MRKFLVLLLLLSPLWAEESFAVNRNLLLMTGFGPFLDVKENPTERIIPRLPAAIEKACPALNPFTETDVLPVEFGAIDSIDLKKFDQVISFGVSVGAPAIRIETSARNYFYDPATGESGPIDPSYATGASLTSGKMPSGITKSTHGYTVELGNKSSAGSYVCNDTFFRTCLRHQNGYFIHIPDVAPTDDARMAGALADIVCRILTVI